MVVFYLPGGSGSRLNAQSDDCTLDSNCPIFNYSVDLPEFSTSPGATRLSQWFQTYAVNDLHDYNDVYINVNIQSNGATSSTYIHESALTSTQGVLPTIYFDDAPGFSENTAQSLEYHAYCPAGITSFNPVLEWARLLVFNEGKVLEVKRPEKYGGNKTYERFEELKKDFENKE